jgi:hypothetical protein
MSDWIVQVNSGKCPHGFNLLAGERGCNHPDMHPSKRERYVLVYCRPSHCPLRTLDANDLKAVLEEAWEHQMANVGTMHEFYRCYTYSGGKTPDWIERARKMLGYPRKVKPYKHKR